MRVQRVIGVLLALLALGGGGFAAKPINTATRQAAELEANEQAEQLAGQVFDALKALPAQMATVAQRAAENEQLARSIATDLATLSDYMRTEAGWETFRAVGNTGLYVGNALNIVTGEVTDPNARSDIEATAPLARDAPATGVASGFVSGGDHTIIAGAAKANSTPNGLPVSVVIARRLTEADLKPIATKLGVVLSVASANEPVVPVGDAALVARLGQPEVKVVKRELADGVHFQMSRDMWAAYANANRVAATQKTIAWVIAGVLAAAALAFAFWPRPQTQLLQQTTAELVRSREELVRLSAKITSIQSLEGAPAPTATPSALDNALGSTSLTAKTTSGRYEILGQLGEGGMAKVYVAVTRGAEGFQRSFVIKRLRAELINNTEAVNQFIDEGRLGASLVHSNIVPVLDFGRDNEGYFLAQEYILGRSIDRLVEGSMKSLGKPLSASVVLYLAQEALKALAYAHGKKGDNGEPMHLVHRDVSPSNLMVSEGGEVKLLDFGIVKSDQRLTKTQAGMVKGNLYFMSPEQAKGLEVDSRSDLFSLGMVLLTALRGNTLYTGNTSYELINRAGAGLTAAELADVRAIPVMGSVLEKALATNRDERFATADVFARAVAAVATPATASDVAALVQQLFGAELAAETEALRRARGSS